MATQQQVDALALAGLKRTAREGSHGARSVLMARVGQWVTWHGMDGDELGRIMEADLDGAGRVLVKADADGRPWRIPPSLLHPCDAPSWADD